MSDNINPDHYAKECSLECIQVMEVILGKEGLINFCLGNAFKYMWRYKNKNGEEDLEKAKWYLEYASNNILKEFPYYEDTCIDLTNLLEKIQNEK